MPAPKRPIDIRAYVNEEVARLTIAALKTMYPHRRHGFQAHPAHSLWIVATDASRDEAEIAASKAWDLHCRTRGHDPDCTCDRCMPPADTPVRVLHDPLAAARESN